MIESKTEQSGLRWKALMLDGQMIRTKGRGRSGDIRDMSVDSVKTGSIHDGWMCG